MQNIYNVSINHNDYKNDKIIGEYYNNQIKNILVKDSNTKFMYYSQIYSYEDIKKGGNLDKVINLKDQKIIDFLNSKFESKAFFKEYVPVLDYEIKKGGSIDYKSYNTRFNCKRFVVQNDDSSGGFGTLLLDEQNYENLKLESNSNYMITKYCDENIPINTHVLISNDKIIIFPSSIQIIEVQNNRLTYKGCDFIAYKNIISDDINKKITNRYDGSYTCTKVYNKPIFNKKYTL